MVLAPSERYHQERELRDKTLSDHARQMLAQVRLWLPNRPYFVAADSSYAVLEVLAAAAALAQPVTIVTRLRRDAALYEPAPPREKGQKGAPRKQGKRQPNSAERLGDPTRCWEATIDTLVWRRDARSRTGEWYGSVVSERQARRTDTLGADP
jgi:hypothetical protein